MAKCLMCGKQIKTMAFVGTGVCGEDCRKDRDNDHEVAHPLVHAPEPVMNTVAKVGKHVGTPSVQS